ncbi:DUF6152 family protein [Sphingomonas bacterium]|uniref:DUF6152 family protein n=1 Tax=Sphingomonas bacterium TaxID=1895847 RepID=UPI001575C1C5|nr:DUF6152 family protein [Sphingomonas bacterium]
MTHKLRIFAALAVLAAPLPAVAHHSFAMFDKTKEIVLKGAVVKEWQWTSPHTWLYVLVPNGSGAPDKYSIEGGNPGVMRRDGFAKGSLNAGDKVTIYMAPLRSGEKGGSLNAVVLPNGKMLGERMKPGA